MKNESCEMLLAYLRSILYDSEIKTLDLQQLDEPFQELGAEMQVLQKTVERMQSYSEALSHAGFSESGAFASIITDIRNEQLEREKLASKVYRDSLTGIQNRLYFEEKMAQMQKDRKWFALCYIDLDDLKQVNDRYGHRAGDEYIRTFVSMVRPKIREYDVFARIGGDEFCVVFPECREQVAEQKMEKILQEFSQRREGDLAAGFSYGVLAVGREGEKWPLDEVLAQADAKMYEMKREHKERR